MPGVQSRVRVRPRLRSGLRGWLLIFSWTTVSTAQTCLVLSPPIINADRTASLDLSVHASPGKAPAAVQWTLLDSSSSITSLTVDSGPALVSADKAAFCAGDAPAYHCLAVGKNTRTIGNGVIAKVTATLAPGASRAAILITNILGASTEGYVVPISSRILSTAHAAVSSDCRLHPLPRGPIGK